VAFRGVDLGRVRAALAGARVELLIAAVAVDLCVFLAKALKWRLLVAPLRQLPVRAFYFGIAVGALVANVVPLRLDEVARSLYLARQSGLRGSTVLGTIVVERAIDVAILLGVVTILLLRFGGESWLASAGVVLAGALALFALARLALRRSRGPDRAPNGLRGGLVGALGRLLDGLGRGVAAMPHGARLAGAFGLGVAEWCLALVHLTLVLAAFGVALRPGRALLLAAASYLGFALPTGPAGLGGFEALVKGALESGLAMEPSRALGIALALHTLLVVPISLVGAAVLLREEPRAEQA
jgi:glycosyltransferase 2 family protein